MKVLKIGGTSGEGLSLQKEKKLEKCSSSKCENFKKKKKTEVERKKR